MTRVIILLICMMLAGSAWAQNQSNTQQKSSPQTSSQQQKQEKSTIDKVKDKVKQEIQKRQHSPRTPTAVTSVRG
jgi:nitrate reductase cytochrome c-type subunit